MALVNLYKCSFDLRKSCMDLELGYYLRSRGNGLLCTRVVQYENNGLEHQGRLLAVDMKLCNSILNDA